MSQHQESAPKLGEILLGLGMISQQQIEQALAHAATNGLRLGESLVQLGIIDEDTITWALGTQLDLSYVDLQLDMIDWDFLLQFSLDTLQEYRMVPLSRVGDSVTAVVADPRRPGLGEAIRQLFPYHEVTVQLSSEEGIRQVLREGARLSVERRFSATGQPRTADSLRNPLEAIENGGATRMVLIQWAGFPESALFIDAEDYAPGMAVETEMQGAMAREIEEGFVRLWSLPGGAAFLRPSVPGLHRPPIRALTVVGLDGWATALAAIPSADQPVGRRPLVVTSSCAAEVKLALLGGAEFLAGAGCALPVLSIEANATRHFPGVFQVEISPPRERLAAAQLLAAAGQWSAIVVEAESTADIPAIQAIESLAGCGPVVVLLRRDEDLTASLRIDDPARALSVITASWGNGT